MAAVTGGGGLHGSAVRLEPAGSGSGSLAAAQGLLLITALLVVFGLTMLYSASYGVAGAKYFRNQLIWVAGGVVSGAVVFALGYRRLAAWSPFLMGGSFLLLLVARFCFDPINGANRWIRIGGFSLQPSEFAKLAVALFVARYCSENIRTFSELRNRRGLLPLAAGAGMVIGGVLLGKDLGTTLLISSMAFLTLMVAGLYWRYFVIPPIGAVLIGVYVWLFDPERLSRVTSYLNPEKVNQDEGYQLWTSLMALGSGSWFGVGFMASRMKAKYLPEAHTDFILAVVGEELGWCGMAAVVICYLLFGFFALRIALRSESRLGLLLGFAITCGITLQAAINLAVVSGSIPTKGMPAPFISYGGSNLVVGLTMVGLLVSIAVDTVEPDYADKFMRSLWNRIRQDRLSEEN